MDKDRIARRMFSVIYMGFVYENNREKLARIIIFLLFMHADVPVDRYDIKIPLFAVCNNLENSIP